MRESASHGNAVLWRVVDELQAMPQCQVVDWPPLALYDRVERGTSSPSRVLPQGHAGRTEDVPVNHKEFDHASYTSRLHAE